MKDAIKILTSLYNCTGQQRITLYSTVNQGVGYVCPSSLTRTFRNRRNERNDGIWLNRECSEQCLLLTINQYCKLTLLYQLKRFTDIRTL